MERSYQGWLFLPQQEAFSWFSRSDPGRAPWCGRGCFGQSPKLHLSDLKGDETRPPAGLFGASFENERKAAP